MATGGTDKEVRGLGAGTMQWVAPFQLVDETGAEMFGVTSAGVVTAAGAQTQSGNITISNTAPTLNLSDTTSSAKDLTITVDADKAQLRETAGAAGSLLVLDLANNRVGVATASPSVALEVTGAATISGAVTASAALSIGTLFKLAGIETGLTAHAGGTQAAAYALNAAKAVHEVTVVGSAADSVILPAATGSGSVHIVKNSAAANSMQLFAALTETIDGVASATGVAVAAGKSRMLVDVSAGNWLSLYGA